MIEARHPISAAQLQPFDAYADLLQTFLNQRTAIVERIDRVLNCQKQPAEYQQDLALQNRLFKDCFFALPSLSREQALLRDQLEHVHWNSGFTPRANPGNDLIDPVQLLLRGFHFWRQTHWPGSKGRQHYAHSLFNAFMIRNLTLLCMRVWDASSNDAGEYLARLQNLLDQLWRSSPDEQPWLVRDVRWLYPVAMSPTTDALAGYFEAAEKITDNFSEADCLEIHKAWVLTGAGHLRAQLRHLAVKKNVGIDDKELVLITRMSNALDVALLMEGLVTLLVAYEKALHSGDESQRLALADAICQGISPDPELFVQRLDLLGPYSMIEYLFISTDEAGQASYTATGKRHLHLIEQYQALMPRLAQALLEDCRHSRPAEGEYSPYGALYGFSSNLVELMAFKTLQREAETRFSLEDVFTAGGADKRAWANNWRNLPHIKAEVVQQYQFPQDFADAMHARIEQTLQKFVANDGKLPPCGRLFVLPETGETSDTVLDKLPALPLRFILSCDAQLVSAHKAQAKDQGDLLHCRLEGEFVVSYQTECGWVALTKDLLTEELGEGRDVKLAAAPPGVVEVLALMCPGLVVPGA
jgi:hypothetical protein